MQRLSQTENNVAPLELRRQLDVSYPAAWLMKRKIMEVMRLAKLIARCMAGRATSR